MRHTRRLTCKEPGFSLLEIMIVLALVALVTTISLVSIKTSSTYTVALDMQRVYAYITYVQHRAQADGQSYTIVIDESAGTLTCPFATEKLSDTVVFGLLDGVKGPPAQPTHVLTKAITFRGSKIVCDAQGMVQSGTLYITDTLRRCLYAVSVGVGEISYIRRYRFDGTWVVV